MKIYLKKHYYTLVPCDEDSLEKLKKLKAEEYYYVEVKLARNYKFHKKYMKMLKTAYDNQNKYDNFTSFRYEVEMRSGFYKTHITIKGTTIFFPDSIAFDKMEEHDFEKLFNKSIDIILKHFIPAEKEALVDEILSYCD
jgi:hypothetical protein